MASSKPFASSHYRPTTATSARDLPEVSTKDYYKPGTRFITRYRNEYLDSRYIRQGSYLDRENERNFKRKQLEWKYDL